MNQNKVIKIIIMVLIAISISNLCYSQISTDKKEYQLNEEVKINIDYKNLKDTKLSIISGEAEYDFMGIPENSTTFIPRNTGDYIIRLSNRSSLKIIEEISFKVIENASKNNTKRDYNISIKTDKDRYLTGEIITIRFSQNLGEYYRVEVLSEKESYRFLGNAGNVIRFAPKDADEYTIKIIGKDNKIYGSKNIIVEANKETKINLKESFVINKTSYLIGEDIIFTFNNLKDKNYDLRIVSNESEYKFNRKNEKQVTFKSKKPGIYSAELLSNNKVIYTAHFNVINPKEKKKANKTEIVKKWNIINSKEHKNDKIKIRILRNNKEINEVIENISVDAELEITNKKVKKILFRNIELLNANSINLGIDDVNLEKVDLSNYSKNGVVSSYAIDPTKVEFTDAEVTVKARGTELFKCKEWNFTTQTCYGSWEKIMDIVPGKEYNFTLTPEDPGYAETGVASINSRKPIYHPRETAELIIVVLDTEGHLVPNATVYLNITSPNNILFSYSTINNDIEEIEAGIYTTNFTDTYLEGNYSMLVAAFGEDVNSTMFSYFTVKEYYEFDILRNTPVTIDPWKGPFNSSIEIKSYTNATVFNFSEVLPINFTINSSGGAIIREENDKRILTWNNLRNNSIVSYSAQAPLITPDLYELGQAYIEYGSKIFIEARPWYLAIDPVTISDDQGSSLIVSSLSLNESEIFNVTVQFDATRLGQKVQASANIRLEEGEDTGTGDQSSNTITDTCGVGDNFKIIGRAYNCPDADMICQAGVNAWEIYIASADAAADQQIIFTVEVCSGASSSSPYDIGAEETELETTVTFDDYRDNIVVNAPINDAPQVTLNDPGTGTSVTTTPIDFNFTVTDIQDTTLDNCTLWTNFSGIWKRNHTLYNIPSGNEINFTKIPDDGYYKWNVECYDSVGAGNFSDSNYTVTIAAPPDITGTVNNNGPIKEGEIITFTGACSNQGDIFRLLICNASATTCDTSTAAEEIICEGTNSNDETPSCSVTTDSSYAGTHIGDKATCCDDGGLCDSTAVSVNDWTVYGAPTIKQNASDQGSSSSTPTTAGDDVKFNLSATDPNKDRYRIVVCDTNKTLGGSCNETTICYSDFVDSGSEASCTHNTLGEAGSYSWWAFACDNATLPDDILCSHWNNGTYGELTASPYQVNNKPQVENISANLSYAKYGDTILMFTVNAYDADENNLKLQCGDETGTYNLCESNFGAGERNCSFTFPWTDNIAHEIFCIVNDSYVTSLENVTNITADNIVPEVYNPQINDSDKIVKSNDLFQINITVTDTNSIINVTLENNTNVQMYRIPDTEKWTVNTSAQKLGCTENDGICNITFIATDVAGNVNDSTVMGIWIDDLGPKVINMDINDSDRILRSYDVINISVNATDTNGVDSVSVEGSSMAKLDDIWYIVNTASFFGCNEGICELNFAATDALGNINSSEILNITIDDTKPKINIISPINNYNTSQDNIEINFTPLDNIDVNLTCNITINGSVNNTKVIYAENGTVYNYSISRLNEGIYYWNVTCWDDGPNINTSETRYFTIDLNAPAINLESPSNNTLEENSNTITFEYNVTDSATEIINCSLIINNEVSEEPATNIQQGTTQSFVRILLNGQYNWSVNCTDTVKRTGESKTYNLTVNIGEDITAPLIDLIYPGAGDYLDNKTVMFLYKPQDISGFLNCSLYLNNQFNQTNLTLILNNENNNFTANISEGMHYWNITCVDNSPNKNIGWSEYRNFTIDITKPTAFSLVSPTNNTISNNLIPTLSWQQTNEDNFYRYHIEIDDSKDFNSVDYNYYTYDITTTNYASLVGSDTAWFWRVTAVDKAGNNYTTGYYNYTTDNTNPLIELSSPGNGSWQDSDSVTFSYTATDKFLKNCSLFSNLSGIWRENQTDISPVSGALESFGPLNNLDDGYYKWNILCIDNASNEGWNSKNYSLYIDTSLPVVTLNNPINRYNTSSTTVTVYFTPNDNLAGTLECNVTVDGSVNKEGLSVNNGQQYNTIIDSLNEGNHTWNVTCKDKSNNTITSETRLFTTDLNPPIVNLKSPSNRTVLTTPQVVTFGYNVTDSTTEIINCSLIINNKINQSNDINPKDVYLTFNEYLYSGNYNWSINCTDTVRRVGASYYFELSVQPPVFIIPIAPKNGTSIDRDNINPYVNNNVTLIAELSDKAENELVKFYANLTDPEIEGKRNILLGEVESNSTGFAAINFTGKDSVGNKVYAGNYTWWAESGEYIVNSTRTILVYGGLNISFRFNDELPDLMYGKDSNAQVQEFLKSLGPESDREVNSTYLAEVNTTFTLIKNGTNYTIELIDPDLYEDSFYQPRIIENKIIEEPIAIRNNIRNNKESERLYYNQYIKNQKDNKDVYKIYIQERTEEYLKKDKIKQEKKLNIKDIEIEKIFKWINGFFKRYNSIQKEIVIVAAIEGERDNSSNKPYYKAFFEKIIEFIKEILSKIFSYESKQDNQINHEHEINHNLTDKDFLNKKVTSKRLQASTDKKDKYQTEKNDNIIESEKEWYTKKRENKQFDIHIIKKRFQNNDLIIEFYHDSLKEQPISIKGKINYSLSKKVSSKEETIELRIYDYNNEYFEIKIGRWPAEIIAFESVDTVKPELTIDKTDFSIEEAVEFTLDLSDRKNNKEQKVIFTNKENVWVSNEEEITVSVYDANRNKVEVNTSIYEEDGKFSIRIDKSREFRPGKYLLEIELNKDGTDYIKEQDFSWGVLAVNTHKSIYLPNESSFIGIAVLDDYGKTVCNASVELRIISPNRQETILSTDNGLIKISPECEIYGITDLPDYYTNYSVSETGNYILNLTADTYNGIRTLIDSFSVKENVDFDVSRNGPTRIYPIVPYIMNINIKANKDYEGQIKEYVPASFDILPQEGLSIEVVDDTKILTWEKKLISGNSYNISYQFDAPDISPYLFVVGSLEIGNFSEERKWIIASDLIEEMVVSSIDCIELAGSKVCLIAEVNADDTFYAGTSIAVESDRYGQVTANHTNTNIPYGATIDNVNLCIKWYVSDAVGPTCTISVYNGAWNSVSSTCQDTEQLSCYDVSSYFTTVEQTKDIRSRVYYLGDHPAQDDYLYVNWMFVNVTYTPPAPKVTLNEPSSTSTAIRTPVNFNFTVIDYNDLILENCTLWTNFTGNWQKNKTIFNVGNGTKTNINVSPDDGYYKWNVECFNSYNISNMSSSNYTINLKAPPDIQENVQNNGTVNEGETITFWSSCYNPGDSFRLIVCNNSGNGCDINTPADEILCEGSNSAVSNATCTITTTSAMAGTHSTDEATCCDDGGLCDSTAVSVNDWTVKGAPKIVKGPSDHNSSDLNPTQAGQSVNFTATAIDPNSDNYKFLVCNISAATFAGCEGGSVNTLCEETNIPSGNEVSCDFSYTSGKSGSYEWWAFVCKAVSPFMCAEASQGIGVNGSPFYINNIPFVLNITSNTYLAKIGDSITITTVNASDQEDDELKLQCGDTNGNYNLCEGYFGIGERTCSFISPWDDDSPHTIYCVLNDSFSVSLVNTTVIFADNSVPAVRLDNPLNNSFDTDGMVEFNYTPIDSNLESCQLWGNWTPIGWGINITNNSPSNNELNTFSGVGLLDGTYIWNIWCNDSIGFSSFNDTNYTIKVDTKAPVVTLLYPTPDFIWETSTTVDFEYEVNDEGTDIDYCYLIINGTKNETDYVVTENNPNEVISITLEDGVYNWSINCTDTNGHVGNSSSRLLYMAVANNPPTVTLDYPTKNSYINSEEIIFYYTVLDDKGLDNCSLFIDDQLNQTNTTIYQNQQNNFTVIGLLSGKHNWSINCTDNIGQYNKTETISFYVDLIPPEVSLVSPKNNSNYNISDRVLFKYNVTDNLEANIKNCSLYLKGIYSQPSHEEVTLNITQTFQRTLPNQKLYWYVTCYDKAGNSHISLEFNLTVNSTLKIWNNSLDLSDKPEGKYKVDSFAWANWFYPANLTNTRNLTLDKSPPNITLSWPEDNFNTTEQTVTFQYNVTDLYSNITSCWLIIDNSTTKINYSINYSNNITDTLEYGTHTWSINCTDEIGNIGNSSVNTINIRYKDLTLNTTDIIFNRNNPSEGELININATISNIGDEDIGENFYVLFTAISNNGQRSTIEQILVNGLNKGTNITLETSYAFSIGNNTIEVFADSGGDVSESNEENNKANKSILISAYHIYYGDITSNILLDTSFNLSVYNWINASDINGNIFTADSDSLISWTNLKALSRNSTDEIKMDDFLELDLALNMTNLTDSINKSFTRDGTIKNTLEFNAYGSKINNVPIINSTNNSNFITGIMWDISDNNPGEYNGSQDIVFVTQINRGNEGKYGVYDYEIRVPANLERYIIPDYENSISFYVEIS